jgi:hypothetical protein
MRIWSLPQVRHAAAAVLAEWATVRRERPDWPPLVALREAKRRHVHEMVGALAELTKVQELQKYGQWAAMPVTHSKGEPRRDDYQVKRRQSTIDRRLRIQEIAAANPGWTFTRVAKEAGCSRTTASTALKEARDQLPLPPHSGHPCRPHG